MTDSVYQLTQSYVDGELDIDRQAFNRKRKKEIERLVRKHQKHATRNSINNRLYEMSIFIPSSKVTFARNSLLLLSFLLGFPLVSYVSNMVDINASVTKSHEEEMESKDKDNTNVSDKKSVLEVKAILQPDMDGNSTNTTPEVDAADDNELPNDKSQTLDSSTQSADDGSN